MAFLGDLVIRMKADTADFRSDLQKAQNSAHTMGQNIAGAMRTATLALGGLSAVGLAYTLTQGVRATLEMGESFNKLSLRTGIATEDLSAYKVAATLADVPQEALATGLKKLAVNMAAAAGGAKEQGEVFKAMGIKVTDSNGSLRKTDDVLDEIGRSFEGMKDGPGKAALAVALFGKAGDSMIPMLNTLREAKLEAERLGVVFTGDFARGAEEFNDNMKRLSIIGEKFHIMLATAMLPRLVEISREMIEAASSGNRLLAVLNALSQAGGWTDPKRVAEQKEMEALLEREEAVRRHIADIGNNFNMDPGTKDRTRDSQLNGARLALFEIEARKAALIRSLNAGQPAAPNTDPKRDAPIINKMGDEELNKAKARQDWLSKMYEDSVKRRTQDEEEGHRIRAQLQDAATKVESELWAKMERENFEAWAQMMLDQEEAMNSFIKAQADASHAAERARETDMDSQRSRQLRALEEDANRGKEAARALGMSFSSAFEDAIIEGNKLRDVMKGLGQDIARIILRKTTTEPLAAALGLKLEGLFGKDAFSFSDAALSDGSIGGSFASGTNYVPRDMIARIHQGEAIIPAGENARGGGDTFIVDMRGASVEAVQRLEALVVRVNGSIESRAINAVFDQQLRGNRV